MCRAAPWSGRCDTGRPSTSADQTTRLYDVDVVVGVEDASTYPSRFRQPVRGRAFATSRCRASATTPRLLDTFFSELQSPLPTTARAPPARAPHRPRYDHCPWREPFATMMLAGVGARVIRVETGSETAGVRRLSTGQTARRSCSAVRTTYRWRTSLDTATNLESR